MGIQVLQRIAFVWKDKHVLDQAEHIQRVCLEPGHVRETDNAFDLTKVFNHL